MWYLLMLSHLCLFSDAFSFVLHAKGAMCVQFAWRLDHAHVPVQLPICLVCGLWCWIWHVGIHHQFGPKCIHLQRLC